MYAVSLYQYRSSVVNSCSNNNNNSGLLPARSKKRRQQISLNNNQRSSTPEMSKKSAVTDDEIERVRSKFAMASCFEFRMRANSLDLHTVSSTKLAKLARLFRSRSEGSVKGGGGGSPACSPSISPGASPKSSPAQPPRRRFMRVIRDGQRKGEEYENPHVIRKYTQEYVERQYLKKSVSLEADGGELPYTVTGHTILKKHSSLDESDSSPPPLLKHASFKEEVEICEFDKKGREKLEKGRYTRRERLHDSDSEYDSYSECGPIGESEEEGEENKENELPLDTPPTATIITAKSTTTTTTASATSASKSHAQEKDSQIKCENLKLAAVAVTDSADSPPSSPTSDPEKLIPPKKTKMVDDGGSGEARDVPEKAQYHPKETPRISVTTQLQSEL